MIPRMALALIMALATLAMHASVHKMAQPDTRLRMIESLAGARTATDSITLLYNIYDLSYGAAADSAASQIYRIARANRYDEVALDILRDMAQVHSDNDTILDRIQTILEKEFPESNMQKETIIFVKIYRAYLETAYTPEKELKEKVRQIINRYDGAYSTDPYERLMQHFLQCIFISHETQGTLLNRYISALERQLRNIPRQSDKLTARLYRQKAYSYTVNSDYNRAVESDRKLLELYDKIERVNAAQGRPYRNLDRFRLGSLTRMLSNYPALSVGEADSIYLAINHIKAENPSLQPDGKTDQAKIFVDMALIHI
ncbi:MAG: hypothetical protein K2L71_04080 [Muribaculaceae bacterium]|nr:hypothetical protein [Muribaculaceae bacterium]